MPGQTVTDNAALIKVSIVEDNAALRGTLAKMFSDAPGIQCVSAHATGEDAVKRLSAARPEVALVDIHLPGMDGIECVARLKKQMPDLQILMLTRYEQNDLIYNSIRAGATGYLLKNTPRAELVQAVEQVYCGGAPMTMQIARKVMDHFRKIQQPAADVEKLTPREQEVLALLARGYLYKQIGDELGISINTLRNRLRAIYEKLHVHSRTEATVKYLGRD
jgi:Response regulator containing a CheY-like receiver domain and an HTH DNA-binding domain